MIRFPGAQIRDFRQILRDFLRLQIKFTTDASSTWILLFTTNPNRFIVISPLPELCANPRPGCSGSSRSRSNTVRKQKQTEQKGKWCSDGLSQFVLDPVFTSTLTHSSDYMGAIHIRRVNDDSSTEDSTRIECGEMEKRHRHIPD